MSGMILGAIGAILGAFNWALSFLRGRSQLKIQVGLGVIPREIVDGVEMPTPFGFAVGTRIVVVEATKIGPGSLTVDSAGFKARDGRTQFLVMADRRLPARLDESDKVVLPIAGQALVEWLLKGRLPKLDHAFCKTSDGRTRKQRIPQDVRDAVSGAVKARGA